MLITPECKLKNCSPCKCQDKALKNWYAWVDRRKTTHQKLGNLLKRPPGGLVMNSAEEAARVNQKKLSLRYAGVPIPDVYGNCPGFWKLPPQLTQKCRDEPATYFAVQSNEERCEVPAVEHVGTPLEIFKEKDVLPRKR